MGHYMQSLVTTNQNNGYKINSQITDYCVSK